MQRTKTAGGFQVKSTSKDLPKVAETNGRLRIEFPGMTVEFETQPNSLRTTNYDQIAKTYVTRFDKNNNKYLEKDELAGGFAQQFAMWDADGDGKVFEKEIAESYTRMQAPQLSQIRATARSHGNPFFKAIDRSGDGRLSLREMKTAAERLKSFDKNKDGRISADEVPRGITLAFGVGSSRNFVVRRSTPAGRPAPPRSDAPDWFTRMDRNGDGDVTLKEFLGEREDFVRLDTNKDGFIEPAEAKAADAAGKKQKESSDDVDSE